MTSAALHAVGAAALLALALSCAPAHVQLALPPSQSAPLELRRAYYEKHRPTAVHTAVLGLAPLWEPKAYVMLADGTRIDHGSDLAPVVERTSPTALAATRSDNAERRALAWRVVAITTWAVAVTGLTVMLVAQIAPLVDGDFDAAFRASPSAPTITAIGGGSIIVTGGLTVVASLASADAAVERETSFLTYERSLRQRLALSEEDAAGARHGEGADDDATR